MTSPPPTPFGSWLQADADLGEMMRGQSKTSEDGSEGMPMGKILSIILIRNLFLKSGGEGQNVTFQRPFDVSF